MLASPIQRQTQLPPAHGRQALRFQDPPAGHRDNRPFRQAPCLRPAAGFRRQRGGCKGERGTRLRPTWTRWTIEAANAITARPCCQLSGSPEPSGECGRQGEGKFGKSCRLPEPIHAVACGSPRTGRSAAGWLATCQGSRRWLIRALACGPARGSNGPIRQRVAGLGSQPTPECGFPRKDAGRRPSQEPVAKTAAMAGRASAARAHPEPAQVGDRAAPFRIARASPRRARRTGLPAFACGAIDRWLLRGAGARIPGIEPRRFSFRTRPACRRERPVALRRVESRPLNDAGRRLGSPPDRATAPVAARHRAWTRLPLYGDRR